jgi:hypothetical protein
MNLYGFGDSYGPKPYKFIWFGDSYGPNPYEFIGFGDSHGPKPYKFIGFGDIHGPKPYKFIGFGDPGPRCTSGSCFDGRGPLSPDSSVSGPLEAAVTIDPYR